MSDETKKKGIFIEKSDMHYPPTKVLSMKPFPSEKPKTSEKPKKDK